MSSESRNEMGPVMSICDEGHHKEYENAHDVFHQVKDTVIEEIHKLHHNDQKHGLHETDNIKVITKYVLYKFAVENVAYGHNYFGKIMIDGGDDNYVNDNSGKHDDRRFDNGKFIHARAFKGTRDGVPVVEFYSLRTEPEKAIWSKEDPLTYFND